MVARSEKWPRPPADAMMVDGAGGTPTVLQRSDAMTGLRAMEGRRERSELEDRRLQPAAAPQMEEDQVSYGNEEASDDSDLGSGGFDSVIMEEEFDKQRPGLPGAMTPAVLQQTHGKLLARSGRWEGQDAPSAAELRLIEQIIDARLQAQYAQKMEELEENAHSRIGQLLAVRSAVPHSFQQAMTHALLTDHKDRNWRTRAVACLASLLTVLLSLSAVLALTRGVGEQSCTTNLQCQRGGHASYCSPTIGICRLCSSAVAPSETGTSDAIGFCVDGADSHPACDACGDGRGFGQWHLVVLSHGEANSRSTGLASVPEGRPAVFNSTWGIVTEHQVVSDRLDAMRLSDSLALVFSAAVVACGLGMHIRDVKLCELELRRNNNQQQRGKVARVPKKWHVVLWLSCMVRQYAILPAVSASVPLRLVGTAVGSHVSADAYTICMHAVLLCFALLALDYMALESALSLKARIAVELDFARSRATNRYPGDTSQANSCGHRLLAVSEKERTRVATNEMLILSTVLVQFVAMLVPVFLGSRTESVRKQEASLASILAARGPFLGSLFCGALEGAGLADAKLSTASRLWSVAAQVGKWLAGVLTFLLLDMFLLL